MNVGNLDLLLDLEILQLFKYLEWNDLIIVVVINSFGQSIKRI